MLDIKQIESDITGNTFIEKIYFFDEVESTNNFAKTLTGENNILVLADYQTRGRGRLERNWISERNSNLTFTIKKHFEIETNKIQFVNFFTAYVMYSAILKFIELKFPVTGFSLTIKWPNDILLNGKKLFGMLIENVFGKNDFIIGAGINVNQENFPEEITSLAISLKSCFGSDVDCNELLIYLIKNIDSQLHLLEDRNYPKIFKLWRDSNKYMGKKINFMTNGRVTREAQVIDFYDDGGIGLAVGNKEIVYYSGDIKIIGLI